MVRDLPALGFVLPRYGRSLIALVLTQAVGDGVLMLTGRNASAALGVILALFAVGCMMVSVRVWGAAADPAEAFPAAMALVAFVICAVMWGAGVRRYAAPVLVARIVIERIIAMRPVVLRPASEVLCDPASPVVRFVQARLAGQEWRMTAIDVDVGHPNASVLFGLSDFRSVAALHIARFYDYMHAISPRRDNSPSSRLRS